MFETLHQHVIEGNEDEVIEAVEAALAEGIDPSVILNEGLILPMKEVGDRFESGEFFVPEMLIAAQAMAEGLDVLRPHLLEAGVKPVATAVIGTVRGDLHDIGKNLVGMMLEGGGFAIVDLGTDVSPQAFADAVKTHSPELVCMSALLTTTMLAMRDTIETFNRDGLRDQVKVMVGGAPVTQEFATQIGADGFAPDAASAARLARKLAGVGDMA